MRSTYTFDNVLTSFSIQKEVFEQTLELVIQDVLSCFECTMFAYGQTGTGKTHTMEGDPSSEENRGIIPIVSHWQAIFERLVSSHYIENEGSFLTEVGLPRCVARSTKNSAIYSWDCDIMQ